MSIYVRLTLMLVLAMGSAVSTADAQTPIKAIKKASVAGKVTIKGKPAAGVTVGVRSSDMGVPFQATYRAVTDFQGLYRITDIPPGSYQVFPLAPAFVTVNESGRGKSLVLSEGETVDNIDFTMIRGGVISGKITDADGRPVIEQRVNLVQAELTTEQRMQGGSVAGVITDDRGIYRMFGLNTGRYKVSVGQSQDSLFPTVGTGRPVYKETFHPDVNDYAKATIIEVKEGSESNNVDIALGRVAQTFSVNGRAIDGVNSEPVSNLRFGIRHIAGPRSGSFISAQSTSNSQGQFTIDNLLPGKYAVFILPQANNPIRGEAVSFEIIDQDIKDLIVTTSKGGSVSGMVALENTDNASIFARLIQLKVQGFVQSASPGGNIGHSVAINSDGSFQLTGLEAGNLYLSLGPWADKGLKGFNVVRTERDGIAQPRGIEIKSGEQLVGVRLVIAYGSGTLRGTVTVANGSLPTGGRIYLRLARPGEANLNMRPPELDSRGHFLMEGLPVGAYEITAYVSVPGQRTTPTSTKQQFTISDESTTEVMLTLDLSAIPGP